MDRRTGIRWFGDRASTATDPKGYIDEVRIATTWQGAVVAPEPATVALLGLGLAGLLVRRRNSRENVAESPNFRG